MNNAMNMNMGNNGMNMNMGNNGMIMNMDNNRNFQGMNIGMNNVMNPGMNIGGNYNPQQNSVRQKEKLEFMKKQARQCGELLKKQKKLVEEMERQEQIRKEKKKNQEYTVFFNHNYDILPITFKPGTTIAEALKKYLEDSHKQNVTFKFEEELLDPNDSSGKKLGEIEGFANGAEITVE